SEALLDELWDFVDRSEFAWEHVWRVGDLVLWDNRCTMHRRRLRPQFAPDHAPHPSQGRSAAGVTGALRLASRRYHAERWRASSPAGHPNGISKQCPTPRPTASPTIQTAPITTPPCWNATSVSASRASRSPTSKSIASARAGSGWLPASPRT